MRSPRLPEAWTLLNEGENSWTAFDVVGHLITVNARALDTARGGSSSCNLARLMLLEPVDRWAQERRAKQVAGAATR